MVVLTPLSSAQIIEIAIVERRQSGFESLVRAANIDNDAVAVELIRNESGIDHECRAMQRLRRPENIAAKRMGNHDVVANFDSEHREPPQDRQ